MARPPRTTERSARAAGRQTGAWWLVCLVAALPLSADPSPPEFVASDQPDHPGDRFTGWRYQDPDVLADQSTRLAMRFGRSRSLFAEEPAGGWSVDWLTSPTARRGWTFGYRGADLGANLRGTSSLGIDSRWLGSRREDVLAGWESPAYRLRVETARLEAAERGTGLSREAFEMGGWGFEARQDTVRIDPELGFVGPLQQAALSAEGYGLGQRRLGQSAGGYGDLNSLGGLTDTYRRVGYQHGELRLRYEDRRLDGPRGGLGDIGVEATLAGVSLRHLRREVDPSFGLFKPTGYGTWERLRDGREDLYQAGVQTDLVTANASLTRTLTGLSTPWSGRGRTDAYTGELTVRPLEGWSATYGRTDRLAGRFDAWNAENRGLAAYAENRWRLDRAADGHTWSLQARRFRDSGQQTVGSEWGGNLSYGELLNAAYTESTSRRGLEAPTSSRTRRLTAESGVGLSGLTEWRTTSGRPGASHHAVRLDRAFGGDYEVGLGWQRWDRFADKEYYIGGLGEIIDGASTATAYDAALTARPGWTDITAWQRWLYRAADDAVEGAPGQVTETGLTIGQRLWRMIGVRAGWSRAAWDQREQEQRREVALELSGEDLRILPSARFGYRETRPRDGEIDGTWFGGAQLRPYGGLTLAAEVAMPGGPDEMLTYRPRASRSALSLSATQSLASTGELSASYAAQPIDDEMSRADGDGSDLARQLDLGMTLPSQWLHPSLTVSGRFNLRSDPGVEFLGEGSRHSQTAEVQWKPSDAAALTLRYRFGGRRGMSWFDEQEQRVEVGYQGRLFGRGRFTLEGWLEQPRGETTDTETYRVGAGVQLPF